MNTLLVGRDPAVREVSTKIRGSVLTFLYGESGSGMYIGSQLSCSSRQRPSLSAKLFHGPPTQSAPHTSNYALRALGIGGDVQGAVAVDSVFEQLRTLRARTGRRPLLIFDQLDDYQSANRARFRLQLNSFSALMNSASPIRSGRNCGIFCYTLAIELCIPEALCWARLNLRRALKHRASVPVI
jgi:hypothetical protein